MSFPGFGRIASAMAALLSTLLVFTVDGQRAQAADAETPTVVLGLEALNGAPENVAAEITDALRQRVAATKGYQLLQGKDLIELKLVFACPDEAPACMSQAGKSLGASKLIFGNVKPSGNDYLVTLKLLDVNRGVVESFTADAVPKKHADPNALRAMAPVWLAKLGGKAVGSVQVHGNLPGAAVSLDGTRVGVTGADPVVVNDVAPGRHEVSVEKSGYTTSKQEFTLAAGQSLPLDLTLNPVSVEVPKPEPGVTGELAGGLSRDRGEPEDTHTLTRIGFWVATVGTAVSGALALKFGLDVRDVNKTLDQYRRFPCQAATTTGYCDGNGRTNVNPMLSTTEKQTVHSLTDSGNRDELLQWVFVGLTGAFAVGSAVLLYKGYLSSEGDHPSASNHGLRIFPTATASAGGIIAEFDF
jgi:hypothetical protein